MSKPSDRTLVIIPTYNERDNLPLITQRVRSAAPDVDILIVDDNSPDGTGDLADDFASNDEQIFVLHREGKGGLCGAYVAGFQWGLERDYQVLCEMDADGSHAPEQLHLLLAEVDRGAELVIGSRYIPGGKVVNWPKKRWLLSKGGNIYISLALGAGLSDMTAGYRAYRRSLIEALDLNELSPTLDTSSRSTWRGEQFVKVSMSARYPSLSPNAKSANPSSMAALSKIPC